jgi:hypothetical protein
MLHLGIFLAAARRVKVEQRRGIAILAVESN